MKVALITYQNKWGGSARAETLKRSLAKTINVELIIISNERFGFIGFLEIIRKISKVIATNEPDIFFLAYPGYLLLLPVLILASPKPVIFDEYINPIEESIYENHSLKPTSSLGWGLRGLYRLIVKNCKFILSDNDTHAQSSAKLNRLSLERYRVVQNSINENIYHSSDLVSEKKFKVLFYCDNRKRAGLQYVLEAALRLKNEKNIEFTIAHSDNFSTHLIHNAKIKGANIINKKITENGLRRIINNYHIFLGGPFGNTVQAKLVIPDYILCGLISGRPVVVGKTKVMNKFKDLNNCLIVAQGSTKAIVDKIFWAYKHKRNLKGIANRGLILYRIDYSNKVAINNCQKILDEFL